MFSSDRSRITLLSFIFRFLQRRAQATERQAHPLAEVERSGTVASRVQRAQGKGPYCAVRALAFKWIRIIFRCWKDRVAYDDEKYVESLRRRRSPLIGHLQPAV